ncbi:MAG: ROK family transcriptional regulator [Betaproteobacteria bacterium]|nr:ROK family transcriptional regulator [Betaproteobacteria bacterium]
MSITGDQSFLKQINRMALVRVIQQAPALSRADLAKETGLTKSTVSLLVQELIDEGWFVERKAQVTGALGRRPTPLYIDSQRLALIGADLGVESISVVAVSLTGNVLDAVTEPLPSPDQAVVIHRLAKLIAACAERLKHAGRTLLGIGLGVPGPVNEQAGTLKYAPNLGWSKVQIVARLGSALKAAGVSSPRIFMQNEADVAALGEFEFGERPIPEPLVYLSLGVGVGAGIVANDRLFSGVDGSAGDFGHSILQVDGPECYCGRRGCAETFIGLRAIGTQIAAWGEKALSTAALAELAARGDARMREVLTHAGRYLGVLAHNIWTAFKPGRIVFGGPACELGPYFFDTAAACMQRYAESSGLPAPELKQAHYGSLAVAVGAAALVLHKLIRPLELKACA